MIDKKKILIYLATPYSHEDKEVMATRFITTCSIAGAMLKRGYNVFSPIAHTHHIALLCDLDGGFEYWETYDRLMIERSDILLVAQLWGHEKSKGLLNEKNIAMGLNKPIIFSTETEIRLDNHGGETIWDLIIKKIEV